MYRLNIPDNRGLYFTQLVKAVSDPEEMSIGMKAFNTPPSYGLLFVLRDSNGPVNVVMEGVRFPLAIMFLRKDWTSISPGLIRMEPGQPSLLVPEDAFYVLEIPVR